MPDGVRYRHMKTTKKTYKHIKKEERYLISVLLKRGCSYAEIGRALSRDKSTISREITGNRRKIRAQGGTKDGPYDPRVANHKAYLKRRNANYQGRKIWLNKPLLKYIKEKLRKGWSPDIISGRMKFEGQPFYASKTAIYEFIYSSYGQNLYRYLPSKRHTKRKRKEKKTKRELIPNRIGIEHRPLTVNDEYGHYEGDTLVSGKKYHSKKAVSVVYGRKAKYVDAKKIPNLKPLNNKEAMEEMFDKLNEPKTCTLDNGIENTKHEDFQKTTGVPVYFCDPYSSWQKGGIENVNKLLRRDIKKGSDISQYSDKYIANVCKKLNNTPRKSLEYKTPKEVMIENNLLKVEEIKMPHFEAIKNTQGVALGG